MVALLAPPPRCRAAQGAAGTIGGARCSRRATPCCVCAACCSSATAMAAVAVAPTVDRACPPSESEAAGGQWYDVPQLMRRWRGVLLGEGDATPPTPLKPPHGRGSCCRRCCRACARRWSMTTGGAAVRLTPATQRGHRWRRWR